MKKKKDVFKEERLFIVSLFLTFLQMTTTGLGFQVALVVKKLLANAGDIRDTGSIPGLGRTPAGGNSNPLQYSCLENPHGQRSLVGYSPWDCKELDMTEHLSTAIV